MFYTYILQSLVSNRYYTGSCANTKNRLCRHNSGKVKSTKSFIPWKLVYEESFQTRSEAVKREQLLKSWKSRKSLERLIAKYSGP